MESNGRPCGYKIAWERSLVGPSQDAAFRKRRNTIWKTRCSPHIRSNPPTSFFRQIEFEFYLLGTSTRDRQSSFLQNDDRAFIAPPFQETIKGSHASIQSLAGERARFSRCALKEEEEGNKHRRPNRRKRADLHVWGSVCIFYQRGGLFYFFCLFVK